MSDNEKYEDLKKRLETIVQKLNDCYEEIDEAHKKATGLKINDSVYLDRKYNTLKNKVLNKKNYIQLTVIPKINERITT